MQACVARQWVAPNDASTDRQGIAQQCTKGWRKIHIGIDEETLEVRAVKVTTNNVGDAPMLAELLDQIPEDQNLGSVTAPSRQITAQSPAGQQMTPTIPANAMMRLPRIEQVLTGINATRLALKSNVFMDEHGCADGIAAMDNYRKRYNARLDTFTEEPLHDRYSNYADALRQWGQGVDPARGSYQQRPLSWNKPLYGEGVSRHHQGQNGLR
jgi:hypothetical protein